MIVGIQESGVSITTHQWELFVAEFAVSGIILKTLHTIAYLTVSQFYDAGIIIIFPFGRWGINHGEVAY